MSRLPHSIAKRGVVRLTVVLLACTLALALVSTPALAGDNVAIYDIGTDETDVESGETVTATVHFSTHGGYGGEGVVEVGSTVSYDDVLTVEDVEAGSFFADDADADLTIDDEDGTLSLDKERVPSDAGTTGDAIVFEITFAVDEDAGPTTAQIELDGHESILETGVQQATFAHTNSVSIAVDGGGDDSTESDDDVDPEGVTIADDQPEATDDGDGASTAGDGADRADDGDADSDGGDGDADGNDDDADDSIPGFAVTATLVAILVGIGSRLTDRRS